MPTLLLSNTTSRALVARPGDIPPEIAPFYEAWADRLLWTLEPGDVAVVPGPVKVTFLHHLCRVLGIDEASLEVLSLRDQCSPDWYPRHNPWLVDHLRDAMAGSAVGGDWFITCYIRDRDIVSWEGLLLGEGPRASAFAENVAELMNTKSVFRCVARAAGVPIANGCVAARGDELVDVVTHLLAETGAVILKQDQNSGGDGNLLVALDPGIPADGASHVVNPATTDRAAVEQALEAHGLHHAADVPSGCAPAKHVVEAYHPHARSTYVELEVRRDAPPHVRNYGTLRMSPLWSGFEIPPRGISAEHEESLLAEALRLAEAAGRLGYHGSMNIDTIVNREGEVLVNEFNGRAGGATHIHAICRRLIGDAYLDEVSMVTRNAVPCSDFDALLRGLDANLIGFDHATRAGVIVVQDNTRETGTIEYVSIGETFDEALRFEDGLDRVLRSIA